MSSPPSRIAELSVMIANHTKLIDEYLTSKKLPYLSFDAIDPMELPSRIEMSRKVVLQATQELNDLLQPPLGILQNLHHNLVVPLHLITRYEIAQKVPVDGEITFKDLAEQIGVNEKSLKQILRMGTAYRVFDEPRPGVLTHSPASRLIRDDKNIESWVSAGAEELWLAATRVVDAFGKWPDASALGETVSITLSFM